VFLGFHCGVVEVFVLACYGAMSLGYLFPVFREDDVISKRLNQLLRNQASRTRRRRPRLCVLH